MAWCRHSRSANDGVRRAAGSSTQARRPRLTDAFKISGDGGDAVAPARAPTDAKFIITNASAMLTMSGNNTVITGETTAAIRSLVKMGNGGLRLTGTQAMNGAYKLMRGPNGSMGGTLSLGLSASIANLDQRLSAPTSKAASSCWTIRAVPDVLTPLTAANTAGWTTGTFRNTTAGTTGLVLGWKDDTGNSQVQVMATMQGDANLDGSVTGTDFLLLAGPNFGGVGNWSQGDFNYDGSVTGSDFSLLAGPQFGTSLSGRRRQHGSSSRTVEHRHVGNPSGIGGGLGDCPASARLVVVNRAPL